MSTYDAPIDVDTNNRVGQQGASGQQGIGSLGHLLVGLSANVGPHAKAWQCEAYLRFNFDWSKVDGVVTACELHIWGSNEARNGGANDSVNDFGDWLTTPGTAVYIRRVKTGWSSRESNAGNDWNSGDYINPTLVPTVPHLTVTCAGTSSFTQPGDAANIWDLMTIVQKWAPPSVKFRLPGGILPGDKEANNGIVIFGDTSSAAYHACFESSNHDPAPNHPPFIRFITAEVNIAPEVGWVDPSGVVDPNPHFTGSFLDMGINEDRLTAVQFEVRQVADQKIIWAPDPIVQTGDGYDVDPHDFPKLKLMANVNYEGRAKVRDQNGKWSPWTTEAQNPNATPQGWVGFHIVGVSPTASIPIKSVHGVMPNLAGASFIANWTTDPAASPAVSYRIQLRARTTDESSPLWQDVLWDFQRTPPQAIELTGPKGGTGPQSNAQYRGPALDPGDYSWRFQVTDWLGNVSDWVYDHTLTLTGGTAGVSSGLTPVGINPVNWRVMLYPIDTRDGKRGPWLDHIKAVIEDPANLGVSRYATSPGQVYFTLPVTHPQIGACDPYQTHYQVQQFRSGTWKTLSEGLLTDFDASENDAIIYGIDYLGLLSLDVETAFQPNNKQVLELGKGGSKYLSKKLGFVIDDQMKRAVELKTDGTANTNYGNVNSPMRFFTYVPVLQGEFPETISIYSAFRQRLDFLRGLLDSHKQGAGVRPRITASQNVATGVYELRVWANSGQDRPNLRLSYGSMIQGYRIIAMQDFAVVVYGIGREPNSVQPHYNVASAVGLGSDAAKKMEERWGHIAKANIWENVVDAADLGRRAQQMAIESSRVGKRVAIGLRTNSLQPEDGWIITDSLPIDIEDGVVSTGNYEPSPSQDDGFSYWTIWGWEYRVFSDAHDEMTLVVRPKDQPTDPQANLIDSDPVVRTPEWALGHGPPPPHP